jgi:hypothetical protein
VAGFIGPIIVSQCISHMEPSIWGWRTFFFLTGFSSFISLILWSIFQTSAIIPELNEGKAK